LGEIKELEKIRQKKLKVIGIKKHIKILSKLKQYILIKKNNKNILLINKC